MMIHKKTLWMLISERKWQNKKTPPEDEISGWKKKRSTKLHRTWRKLLQYWDIWYCNIDNILYNIAQNLILQYWDSWYCNIGKSDVAILRHLILQYWDIWYCNIKTFYIAILRHLILQYCWPSLRMRRRCHAPPNPSWSAEPLWQKSFLISSVSSGNDQ